MKLGINERLKGKKLYKEVWKPVVLLDSGESYEGLYEVSNMGRVRNVKTGKLLKNTIDKRSGYYSVVLLKNKKEKRRRVHRLVAFAFVEGWFEGAVVDHIIPVRNGGTNIWTNLRWVTHKENNNNPMTKNNIDKEARKENLDNIRDLTKEWHGSEEGHEWHKEHYENMKDKLHEKQDMICEYCGKHFDGLKNHSRFCSNKCKSAWRRKEGLDDEVRICEHCGKEYTTNKYSKQRFCSYSCVGSKKVICVETGEIYCNVREANDKTGVNSSSIKSCCNGKYKTAGGFHWKYYEEVV